MTTIMLLLKCYLQLLPLFTSEKKKYNVGFPVSLHTKKLIAQKKAKWKCFKRTKLPEDKQTHKELCRSVRKSLYQDKLAFETKLSHENDQNSFYRYAKTVLNATESIPTLTRQDGSSAHSHIEKAEALNEFFSSVFTQDNDMLPIMGRRLDTATSLSHIVFHPLKVRNSLKALKSKVSSGPDGLPSILFKRLADHLCEPLSTCFNVSFYQSELPDIWRCANVSAVFKKGDKSELGNYRPISLTSVP